MSQDIVKTTSRGVLTGKYAIERLQKKELIFRYQTRIKLVADVIKKNFAKTTDLEILDFGAAEGLTLLELNKLLPGNKIIGIEYSEDLIKQAPVMPSNIKLVKGDVSNLNKSIKAKQYDVVCALALLEHLSNPLLAVQEAAEVLRSGGVFIATSPSPFWDCVSTFLGLLKAEQHESEMTKKKMIELCQQAGFEIVDFQRFMWAPIAFLPYLKISISPSASLKIDSVINKILIFNWLFVNQVVIAKKK